MRWEKERAMRWEKERAMRWEKERAMRWEKERAMRGEKRIKRDTAAVVTLSFSARAGRRWREATDERPGGDVRLEVRPLDLSRTLPRKSVSGNEAVS